MDSLASIDLENTIARNIYRILVPGGMFVGYFVMPIMAGVVPYFWNSLLMFIIYVWHCLPGPLLRLLKAFLPWAPESPIVYPARNAEKGLEPMEIGLPWDYAMNIINPSVC